MGIRFASIVEGKVELQAVPVLIRRILAEIDVHDATIFEPVRVRRDKLLKDSDFELSRAVSFAIAKLENTPGTILILIDSEGDCPVVISRELHNRARAVRLPIHVVVAHIQYETWFLAGTERSPALALTPRLLVSLLLRRRSIWLRPVGVVDRSTNSIGPYARPF